MPLALEAEINRAREECGRRRFGEFPGDGGRRGLSGQQSSGCNFGIGIRDRRERENRIPEPLASRPMVLVARQRDEVREES